MSYVEDSIGPNERVVFRTRLHWRIFVWRWLVAIFLATTVYLIPLAIIILVEGWLRRRSAEFAVTNHRIISKTGILRRKTTDMQVSNVESIAMEQGIMERLYGTGTVAVTASGGKLEEFSKISHVADFRRAIQRQASRASR